MNAGRPLVRYGIGKGVGFHPNNHSVELTFCRYFHSVEDTILSVFSFSRKHIFVNSFIIVEYTFLSVFSSQSNKPFCWYFHCSFSFLMKVTFYDHIKLFKKICKLKAEICKM